MSCKCSQSQREPSFLRLCPYHSTFSSGKMCNKNKMHKWVWKGWSCPFFSYRVCSLVSWTSVLFNCHYKPVQAPPYSGNSSHPKVHLFTPDRNPQSMPRKLARAGSLPWNSAQAALGPPGYPVRPLLMRIAKWSSSPQLSRVPDSICSLDCPFKCTGEALAVHIKQGDGRVQNTDLGWLSKNHTAERWSMVSVQVSLKQSDEYSQVKHLIIAYDFQCLENNFLARCFHIVSDISLPVKCCAFSPVYDSRC